MLVKGIYMIGVNSAFNVSMKPAFKSNVKNNNTNNTEQIKAEIQELEADLQKQLATPPKTRDPHDWGYYNCYMDKLQNRIKELRKQVPVDRTNLDEVMMAKPMDYFRPEKTDNIKGMGISFVQGVPESEEQLKNVTYKAVPIFTNARTVEEMIRIGKRDGIEIEPFKDDNGEYKLGRKNIWNKGEYFNIDKPGVIVQYGKYDADDPYVDQEWAEKHADANGKIEDGAVVATDKNGAEILQKSYLHKGGMKITDNDLTRWNGFMVHKDPKAVVNAVAYDEPRIFTTLEGPIETDVTMGDVDGNPYNNFKQLKKQIIPDKTGFSKLKPNPADKNSAKFVELIIAGEDEKALELLRNATRESEQ